MRLLRHLTLTLAFAIGVSQGFAGNEFDENKNPYVWRLAAAKLYVMGQNYGLDLIKKEHPYFSAEAESARTAFDLSIYGEGYRNIDSRIISIYQDDPKGLTDFRVRYSEAEAETFKRLSSLGSQDLSAAQKLVEKVRVRSQGNFETAEIARVLISAVPRHLDSPHAEMSAGFKKRVDTNGHPHAKGRDISVEIPLTWSRIQEKGANIAASYRSELGSGKIHMVLNIKNIEGVERIFTKDEHSLATQELVDGFNEVAKPLTEPDKARILTINSASWVTYALAQEVPRSPTKSKIRSVSFATISGKQVISLSFNISSGSDENDLSIHKRLEADFLAIVTSLKFNDEKTNPTWLETPKMKGETSDGLKTDKYLDATLIYAFGMPYAATVWPPISLCLGGPTKTYFDLKMFLMIGTVTLPIGMWMLFSKNGIAGWNCLIPLISTFKLLELAGLKRKWAFLLMIPFVGGLVLHLVFAARLPRHSKYRWLIAFVYAFMPALVVGFLGNIPTETPKQEESDNDLNQAAS
jgi:hypothetical protein